jgi:hypothetical protein
MKVELSIELLVLIGLPLMGCSGNPLKYDPEQDRHRPFLRELLLRILKGFDSRRACCNLSLIE